MSNATASSATIMTFIDESKSTARLRLRGDVDICTKDLLHIACKNVSLCTTVFIDLSRVKYIDSTVLREFFMLARDRRAAGLSPVRVTGASPKIARLFSLSGLDALVHLSYDAAVSNFEEYSVRSTL